MTAKPKRRAYLLKRKALTTGFFDSKSKDDKDKGEWGFATLLARLGEIPREWWVALADWM